MRYLGDGFLVLEEGDYRQLTKDYVMLSAEQFTKILDIVYHINEHFKDSWFNAWFKTPFMLGDVDYYIMHRSLYDVHSTWEEFYEKQKLYYLYEIWDCLSKDTEVIFINEDGYYDVKPLKEVKEGDILLSYNFEKGEFEPDIVTKVADKGVKETYHVKLSNGLETVLTGDHKVFAWHYYTVKRNGKWVRKEEILEMRFKDLYTSISRIKSKWHWQLLMAKKIPSGKVRDELAWVKGLYVAEGWISGNVVGIANNDRNILRKAEKLLNNISIRTGYKPRRKNSGAYIYACSKRALEIFEPFGRRALEKTIPPYALSYDEETLREFLDGYYTGDGTKSLSPKRRESIEAWYNTVSRDLAIRLFVCHLVLGKPLRVYCIKRHGGFGKNPIYRLICFRNSTFRKNTCGYTNLTHSTFEVEENGKESVIDITTMKNHNFVLANGQIVHNCDDFSSLFSSYVGWRLKSNTFPRVWGRLWVESDNAYYGHAYNIVFIMNFADMVEYRAYCFTCLYEPQTEWCLTPRADGTGEVYVEGLGRLRYVPEVVLAW